MRTSMRWTMIQELAEILAYNHGENRRNGPKCIRNQPGGLLADALDIKWQHFGRAWNAIAKNLRDRDLLSDAEYHDLCFTFLSGRDMSQIFHAPSMLSCRR